MSVAGGMDTPGIRNDMIYTLVARKLLATLPSIDDKGTRGIHFSAAL